MVWFKVDDNLPFHEKVVAAGNPAMGLWVRAGAWSAWQLTDGFIPDHIATALGTNGQARRLVDVRLWHRSERDGQRGYQFHQWDEEGRQPTRAAVEKDRAEARERMRKAREAKRGSGEVRANTERSSGGVRSTRPDPTRPDQEENSVEGGSHVSSGPSYPQPPLYADRCHRHGHDAEPGPCGDCADARKASRRLVAVGTRKCLIHMEDDVTQCRGCAADRLVGDTA